MIFAYTRVSRREQDAGRQLLILREYADRRAINYDRVFQDQDQSDNFNRAEYRRMKDLLREGDELIITDLDRFGRNYSEIVKEYSTLVDMGIEVTVLDLPMIDGVSDPALKRMLSDWIIQIFSYVAQKEKENIRARVKDGLRKAKRDGKKLGRPSLTLPKKFDRYYNRLINEEITVTEMAKILGKSRSQVYRYIEYYEAGRKGQEQLDIDGHWVPVIEGEQKPKKYKTKL